MRRWWSDPLRAGLLVALSLLVLLGQALPRLWHRSAEEVAAATGAGLGRAWRVWEEEAARREAETLEALEIRAAERRLDAVLYLGGGPSPDNRAIAWRRRGVQAARDKARVLGELQRSERLARLEERWDEIRRKGESGIGSAWMGPFLASAVALGILFGTTALWVVRSYHRPLRQLARTMVDVAGGGERRVSPGGAPDLARTQQAFNGMVDALSAVRRGLEARVDAKTAALAEALEEQRGLNERLKGVLEDLEKTQEKLVRQEKMAALGTLAGGVAHEFNNLLGGIRGCAEEALEESPTDEIRQSLQVIHRAAERGRRIVDGLLRFSRGPTRTRQVVDLRISLEEACALLARPASESGVSLELQPSSSADVLAEPGELQQVIINLIQNALQASPRGSPVEVGLWKAQGRAVLEVADRGPGVPADLASRVFEPFFTTREREGGTGLGLAISHAIVQGLGGTLSCRPREGGGTVFAVDLPTVNEGGHEPTSVG